MNRPEQLFNSRNFGTIKRPMFSPAECRFRFRPPSRFCVFAKENDKCPRGQYRHDPAVRMHYLTVLDRDRTASILGVDLAHHGLRCRFRGCREGWDPSRSDSEAALEVAALRRDSHEIHVHGYHHKRLPSSSWSFVQRFSRRGRSTMKRTGVPTAR